MQNGTASPILSTNNRGNYTTASLKIQISVNNRNHSPCYPISKEEKIKKPSIDIDYPMELVVQGESCFS